jgi:hypothetical protein
LALSKFGINELSYRFKSGPLGPAIITMHLCAVALYINKGYHKILEEYCHMTSSVGIMRIYYLCIKQCTINVDNLIVGRLSLTQESAGKTRLFAICNSFVQSALKPLHDQLMLTLKLFPSDGTFDQIGQFNRILELSKNQLTYSFDLTKATDRFPIILQQVVLEVIVNSKFAML